MEYSKKPHPVLLIPLPRQSQHSYSVIYCSWMSSWMPLKKCRPQAKWRVRIMNRDISGYRSRIASKSCPQNDWHHMLLCIKFCSNLITTIRTVVKQIFDGILLLAPVEYWAPDITFLPWTKTLKNCKDSYPELAFSAIYTESFHYILTAANWKTIIIMFHVSVLFYFLPTYIVSVCLLVVLCVSHLVTEFIQYDAYMIIYICVCALYIFSIYIYL